MSEATRYLPRGPLYTDEQRQDLDRPDDYQNTLINWCDAAQEEALATAKLNDEINEIHRYIAYMKGDFWDPRRPKYKSRFVANRLSRARVDHMAQLTDTRPTIDVFSNDRESYSDIARIIHAVIHHEWQRQHADLSLATVIDITQGWGTGGWKIGAAAPGMLKLTPCGPDQLMPIQPGFTLQESSAVYYRSWKPVAWVKAKYGEAAKDIERFSSFTPQSYQERYLRPNVVPEYTWNGLSPAMQRALGVKAPIAEPAQQVFKSIEWKEYWIDDPAINESSKPVYVCDPRYREQNWGYWVQPGGRLYPRKRLVSRAGNTALYDGPSPFFHGFFPFAMLRLNPVFWSFWGLSTYRELVPINKAMNEIVAGTLDLIKRALNPQAITKDGPGGVSPAAWKEFFSDIPGAKLKVGPMGDVNNAVKYMDAPRLPDYVFQMLLQFLSPEFDRTAGAVDITGLGKKNQVPGGETIEQMRDSLQTPMRLKERYVETFLEETGQQCVPNILQFYTAKQRIRIFGEDGVTVDDFDLDPEHLIPSSIPNREEFYKNFGLRVVPGSLHSGAKDRGKSLAVSGYMAGMISLREALRKWEYTDAQIEKILREKAEEVQMGIGGGPMGRTPRSQAAKTGR